ncbi:MAG: NUDIX hydrolase [Thermodesulfobacteriota bacterium]
MKIESPPIIWHGKVFDFNCKEIVLPNGKTTQIGFIHHPGSSAVIPIFENGSIVLIHQYRPPVEGNIWEIPSGCMLPEEEPLDCARRELQEECGLIGSQFEKIGEILVAPWYSDERVHLFLATCLTSCEKKLDEDEILTTHIFTFNEVMAMIERGEIQDAATIIGLKMAFSAWKKRTS